MTALAAPPTRPLQTTPQRWRMLSIVTAMACMVMAVFGWISADQSERATRTIREEAGPVLIAAQNLRATLAEADAQQASAFLSVADDGGEDLRARRGYEEAMRRANAQLEDVAALIGDDAAAHRAVKEVGLLVTEYAARVEAARAVRPFDEEAGLGLLGEAVGLLSDDLDAAVTDLSAAANDRLVQDAATQSELPWTGTLAGLLALAIVGWSSADLTRRTRRIINPGLLLAGLALVGAVGWLVTATALASQRFDDGLGDGYQSIVQVSDLQRSAFNLRSRETILEISAATGLGDASDLARLRDAAETDARNTGRLLAVIDGLASTDRERALTQETIQRYDRWRGAEQQGGDTVGSFNGFVFAAEGVLADNRDRFLGDLDWALGSYAYLGLGMIALAALAAIASLAGFQQRINEYR